MNQVLPGSATVTAVVHRAIQHSQSSLRALASRFGISPKTVAKWQQRSATVDLPTGSAVAKSANPSAENKAIVIAFRRHTLLPLDDCLFALEIRQLWAECITGQAANARPFAERGLLTPRGNSARTHMTAARVLAHGPL